VQIRLQLRLVFTNLLFCLNKMSTVRYFVSKLSLNYSMFYIPSLFCYSSEVQRWILTVTIDIETCYLKSRRECGSTICLNKLQEKRKISDPCWFDLFQCFDESLRMLVRDPMFSVELATYLLAS
jgi:hypothetical protein